MPETFQLTREQIGQDAQVLRVQGKFDRDAGLAVETLVGHDTRLRSVLNLADVSYISSSGIAELVRLATRRGVRVASPAACVQDVLHLAGISALIPIHQDEQAALDAR